MIQYTTGNLLTSNAEALVNTVNTVGVMGKGIALQFKNLYPQNFRIYQKACKADALKIGELLIVEEGNLVDRKLIINFPTKQHWREPSQYDYIEKGLRALRMEIESRQIRSIAIPPLGCGNGGLDWSKVKPMIQRALHDLEAEIYVFEPSSAATLDNMPPVKEVKLTPARAMLLYLMFQYEAAGEPSSLFIANKLAYFLQRSGEHLKLNFEAHHYGPFAIQVNHVLLHLNGTYLTGLDQNKAQPFDAIQMNYERMSEVKMFVERNLTPGQHHRLKFISNFLRGFESAFSIELLATVDFIITSEGKTELDSIVERIQSWNRRKAELFDAVHVEIAHKHLQDHGTLAFN